MTQSDRFPLFRLLVISGAIFVSVASEFLPTGLLPDIAADLDVSKAQVGLLVTVFAFTVVASTTPLTLLTQRFPRKGLMVVLLIAFAVSNVLAAVAPTYAFLVGARIFGGLAHGLFWAVAAPYSSRLVTRAQLVRALSVTNAGGTAAFILGIPLGTVLGHALGWRFAFLVMAGVVLVFTALVVVSLPPVEHVHTLATGEISLPYYRDRTIPAVVAACVLTVLVMLGHNTFYTYIASWTIEIAGFPTATVGPLLFVSGAAGAIGLALSGVFGDRHPRATFWVLLGSVGIAMIALAAFSDTQWAVIALFGVWGIAFGGLPSLLHGRVLGAASPRIRDVSAAALTTAFNLAIGSGALVGGLLLNAYGLAALPVANLVLVVAALCLVIVGDVRHPHRHTAHGTSGAR